MLPILLLLACQKTPDAGDVVADVHIDADPACDALGYGFCFTPWPSDRWLADDPTTPTGKRLAYDATRFPLGSAPGPFDVGPWNELDGVSPASQIMAMFPVPPDLSDVAFHTDIARSLDDDHPTLLVDLDTGERLPHWVELDAQAQSDDRTLVFVRPIARLKENRRYAVVFRDLVDVDGAPLAASDGFAALRDGLSTDSADLEARRAAYEDLFATLEDQGVARDSLQLAWWFTTASGDSIRRKMRAIVADADARLGERGLGCTVTEVIDSYGADTGVTSYRLIRGTFTAPSYLDRYEPPSRLVLDDDGLPVWQEDVDVEFTAVIPWSVADSTEPAPLLEWGHGLMAAGAPYVESVELRSVAEASGVVIVATNWAGMSEDDLATTAAVLYDASSFPNLSDRLHQGMVNFIAQTRAIAGVCQDDPAFRVDDRPVVDPDTVYYAGGSQGGFLGATLLAVHPDIERGLLFVNGINFPFTMERSIAFADYLPLMQSAYPDRVEQAWGLSMTEHLWETVEGAGYAELLVRGDGTFGGKSVLSVCAENDAQVGNLASDYAARTFGIPVLRGSTREPYGLDVVDGPYTGSAYITIDVGDPDVPAENVAPTTDAGGHDTVGYSPTSQAIVGEFLKTGTIPAPPCEGPCDPD